jgi:predicted enzyme related to lactoylglutathione lyase
MNEMNPVVHFEMPYEDKQRMVDFYTKTFGWQAEMLGSEMGNYVVVATTESDPSDPTRRPKTPGTINGGFYKKNPGHEMPTITIAVKDIYAAMKHVTNAGGKVLGGSQGPDMPDDIPGVGLYTSIIDTEGNIVSLLQPKRM